VAAFWRISEETFMDGAGFIDDLRMRISWGQTGNSPTGNYLYFNTYTAGSNISYMDMQGVMPSGIELTSLQWETIDQINPGISFTGLDNSMNVEIDYYKKKHSTFTLKIPEFLTILVLEVSTATMVKWKTVVMNF
jgi:TonB-dependent starch-binding outer membrane protein SusC